MASGKAAASRGFAYVLLITGVAVIGVVAANALSWGATMARRSAEQELLAVGLEMQQAIRSYAASGGGRGPRRLDDLLRDPRVPGVLRHLRQLRADPLTGQADWGLVTDLEGAITGVYSLAPGTPIQRTGFATSLTGFEEAVSYSQWVFGMQQAPVGRLLLPPKS